jgi:hypothetical protein
MPYTKESSFAKPPGFGLPAKMQWNRRRKKDAPQLGLESSSTGSISKSQPLASFSSQALKLAGN